MSSYLEEACNLIKSTNDFSSIMLTKIFKKMKDGFSGWNDPRIEEYLIKGLEEHIAKGFNPDNLVDIAVYCSFLWKFHKDWVEKADERK